MAIERPDLLSPVGLPDLEVVQLTHEPDIACSHIYMEAQIFTPDSKRLVLHRSAHAHGSDRYDPEHRYLLCDLDEGCSLTPLTHELGATGPSISPDGQYLYYFVDETHPTEGRLILKRVRLDGTDRTTLYVLDRPLPGTPCRASRPYPLSTISSDGKRLAISVFLGDGTTLEPRWGLVVFGLDRPSVELVLEGPTWSNMHPQYSRSLDPEQSRDILVQENHYLSSDPAGDFGGKTDALGADIHVVRDDGTAMRDLPWGRDGEEFCQGHQCWRGRSDRAITSTDTRGLDEHQLIEGVPVFTDGPSQHLGRHTPGGVRNDLSRSVPHPLFHHFATDIAGKRLITDSGPKDEGGGIYLADLPDEDDGALENVQLLLRPRSSWKKEAHIHPFLSSDGKAGFFNSDESGTLQAYMVRGWD